MIKVCTHKRKGRIVRSHMRKKKSPGYNPLGMGHNFKNRSVINTKARKAFENDNDMMAEDASLRKHPKTGVYRRSIIEGDWNTSNKKLRYGKSHSSSGVSEGRTTKTLKKIKRSYAKSKVSKVMGEFKRGTLHSGSKKGPKVKSRKQAIAIALSEQRKAK